VDFDTGLMNGLESEGKVIFCTMLKELRIRRKEQRRKEEVEKRTDVGIRNYESDQPILGNKPRSRALTNPKPDRASGSTWMLTSSCISMQKMSCEI
jgi:hypothetical protein